MFQIFSRLNEKLIKKINGMIGGLYLCNKRRNKIVIGFIFCFVDNRKGWCDETSTGRRFVPRGSRFHSHYFIYCHSAVQCDENWKLIRSDHDDGFGRHGISLNK